MTRKLISVPIFGLMLVAGLLEAASPPPQVVTAPPYAPDHVLIKFKSDASETDRMVFRAELQADFLKSYRSGAELWRLPPSVTVDAAIRSLQDDSLIEYVEPDCHMRLAATTPADANFPQQWSLYNTGQKAGCNLGDPNGTPGVDIDATLAWDISTGISDPNQRPIIAVIDTGVDYDHPDLASNMWVNLAEANGDPQVDDDGNGYLNDVYGWDFRDNDADPAANADFGQGHGTHVAGIAGAVGKIDSPSEGVAGINWKSRIMALKVLTSRTCDQKPLCSDVLEAVDYSVMMHADVINASWTVDSSCTSADPCPPHACAGSCT